jgi:hypothetical protein
LCAWQWGRKSAALRPGAWRKATVAARYGWQASGLKISDGERYDVAAAGEWRIAKDGARYSANGDANGRGRLIGVVLSDYRLSSPFDLGVASSFLAPADGDLYLRCQDDWWSLADNDGELTVSFRVTPRRAGERVPGGQALQGDDDKVGEVLLLDETDSKSDSPPLLPFAPQRGVQIVELLRLPPEDVRGKPRVELGLGGAEPKKFTPCKQVSGKEILGKFGLPDSVRTVTGKLALGAGGQQQEIKWQLWAYGNVMFFVDEADTTRYMCVDAVKPQQEEKAAEPKP